MPRGRKVGSSRLSKLQKKAIDLWFTNGFNKQAAMRDAGYSHAPGVCLNSYQTFGTPAAQDYIAKRQREYQRKYKLDADWVVERLMRIAAGPEILAKYKRVLDDGSLVYDFSGASQDDLAVITELTNEEFTEGRGQNTREIKKFKVAMADPKGALDSLMRHLGLFKDQVNVSIEADLVSRLQRGRERVANPGENPRVEQKVVPLVETSRGVFVPSTDD